MACAIYERAGAATKWTLLIACGISGYYMKFPERKHNRLKEYDYSRNGAYFITACTKDRKNIFWEDAKRDSISRGAFPLSSSGIAVQTAIENIPEHYQAVNIDKYVIMPNHVHMILLISKDDKTSGRLVIAPTVSQIVKGMKTFVSKQIGSSIWQRSFHDHIIRNEQDYQEIWEYIDTNPLRWKNDCYYE